MKKLIILPWAALAFTLVAAETQLIPKGLLPDSLPGGKKSSQPSARPEPPPFESPEAMQAEFVRRFTALGNEVLNRQSKAAAMFEERHAAASTRAAVERAERELAELEAGQAAGA